MFVNEIIKIISFSFIGFLLTGCAEKSINVNTTEVERTKLNLEQPSKLNLNDVNFIIITEKNSSSVFKQLETAHKDKILIGLTDDDYIKMSENLQELKHYILKQQQIIKSYKEYYETTNEK